MRRKKRGRAVGLFRDRKYPAAIRREPTLEPRGARKSQWIRVFKALRRVACRPRYADHDTSGASCRYTDVDDRELQERRAPKGKNALVKCGIRSYCSTSPRWKIGDLSLGFVWSSGKEQSKMAWESVGRIRFLLVQYSRIHVTPRSNRWHCRSRYRRSIRMFRKLVRKCKGTPLEIVVQLKQTPQKGSPDYSGDRPTRCCHTKFRHTVHCTDR
ncbi:hypothetical protein PHSY_003158 [Pseudozyma hubeiensis SY62]|uniref:Uncharacterized protein n=1 Tax=Pseudozyma hubeiensis (strain SY62) TaxID=1305764 RepID=R9P2V6_PSEHS|nr:hypothetical protein PHSY_003158 [Pseudozyma hubeiensis SY62]GAC95582.1 hypothetical protein PHSY_003158 [Pseudozyma hubeiensis SY62]